MKENIQDNGPSCIFMMGVNDSRTAIARRFNARGRVDYDWGGNTEFSSYTRTAPGNRVTIPILWFQNKAMKISVPDIFVNCISDADNQAKSLVRAAQYLDMVSRKCPGMPVFNDPRKVAGTRRDTIYQRFGGLPGIEIPRIIRFQPKNRDDVLAMAEKEGFTYPFIVRNCGAHNGRDMVLLESPDRAADLDCLAFNGSYFYLTQFRDYKNAAGLYSKTRFIIMGGRIYPRHSITSRHWLVNSHSRGNLMGDNVGLRETERQVLSSLEKIIAPAALDSVRKIYRDVGLDYLGFDCHVLPNGNLLFFEINAAMNGMGRSDYKTYPYLKGFTEDMVNGYNALLAAKIAAGKFRRRA